MVRSAIPSHILKQLGHIELDAQFSGGLPQVSSSSGKTYYAKTGTPREREQFVGEAESLRAIALAAPGLAPSLLAFGFVDEKGEEINGSEGRPFFISEYKDLRPLTVRSGAVLGKRLATELHNHTSPNGLGYGFAVPTFCGATRLRNGWYETWERCFDVLIGDLLSTLEARGGYSDLCRRGQDVRLRRVSLSLPPPPPSAVLHSPRSPHASIDISFFFISSYLYLERYQLYLVHFKSDRYYCTGTYG